MQKSSGIERDLITNNVQLIKEFVEEASKESKSKDQQECIALVGEIARQGILDNVVKFKDLEVHIMFRTKDLSTGQNLMNLTVGFVQEQTSKEGNKSYRVIREIPAVIFNDDGKDKRVFIHNQNGFMKLAEFKVRGDVTPVQFIHEWINTGKAIASANKINGMIAQLTNPVKTLGVILADYDLYLSNVIPSQDGIYLQFEDPKPKKEEIPMMLALRRGNIYEIDASGLFGEDELSHHIETMLEKFIPPPSSDKPN